MKHLLLRGLFCCVITGSILASDMVPFIQDVALGLVKGAAWPIVSATSGVVIAEGQRRTAEPGCEGDATRHFWYGVFAGGAGSVGGVAHGLKKIVVDKEYTSGTMTMLGSLSLPTLSYLWYKRKIAENQMRRNQQQEVSRPEDEI